MSDAEKAVFIEPDKRRRAVPLSFPLSLGGKDYREIIIARPSVGEISEWVERLKDDAEGTKSLAIYQDADGAPIPQAVLMSLDPDDDEEVTKAARDFLPRRVLVLYGLSEDSNASHLTPGEPTAPTSNA